MSTLEERLLSHMVKVANPMKGMPLTNSTNGPENQRRMRLSANPVLKGATTPRPASKLAKGLTGGTSSIAGENARRSRLSSNAQLLPTKQKSRIPKGPMVAGR